MSTRIVAGIDIGGTNTKYGLVDEFGRILVHDKVITGDYERADDFAKELTRLILDKKNSIEGADLLGVGIGSPNGNYYSGTVEFAPNLPWKGMVPLVKYFKQEIDLPVTLTNDAKAGALGEMIFGGARKMKHFIFITLGTGLGSGIVSNGSLVYGHDGFAGEMGHTIIEENGRPCGCGRKGCLEQYVSATGIKKTYLEILEKSGQAGNIDPESVDSRHIFEKARGGDEAARESFEITGHRLGLALANSMCYLSPEAIFLFGGLAQSGDMILEPTRRHFENNLLKVYEGKTNILLSSLKESDAAILGAASLIWTELKKFP